MSQKKKRSFGSMLFGARESAPVPANTDPKLAVAAAVPPVAVVASQPAVAAPTVPPDSAASAGVADGAGEAAALGTSSDDLLSAITAAMQASEADRASAEAEAELIRLVTPALQRQNTGTFVQAVEDALKGRAHGEQPTDHSSGSITLRKPALPARDADLVMPYASPEFERGPIADSAFAAEVMRDPRLPDAGIAPTMLAPASPRHGLVAPIGFARDDSQFRDPRTAEALAPYPVPFIPPVPSPSIEPIGFVTSRHAEPALPAPPEPPQESSKGEAPDAAEPEAATVEPAEPVTEPQLEAGTEAPDQAEVDEVVVDPLPGATDIVEGAPDEPTGELPIGEPEPAALQETAGPPVGDAIPDQPVDQATEASEIAVAETVDAVVELPADADADVAAPEVVSVEAEAATAEAEPAPAAIEPVTEPATVTEPVTAIEPEPDLAVPSNSFHQPIHTDPATESAGSFTSFQPEVSPDMSALQVVASSPPPRRAPSGDASMDSALEVAFGIDGALCAAVTVISTGDNLASIGTGADAAVAGHSLAAVLRSKLKIIAMLRLDDELEDMIVTTGTQLHLTRMIDAQRFLFVVLDRRLANLALARYRASEAVDRLRGATA